MASILSPKTSTGPKPKTHASFGTLPPFIDPKQPPTKRSPWRQIQSTPFISSLTITLQTTLYDAIWPRLLQSPSISSSSSSSSSPPQPSQHQHFSMTPTHYAKLILTLKDIITGPFFTNYIKRGNILLISSGQPGISNWFCTLHDGRLTLEMGKDLYERCGLQGAVTERNGGARKHGRDRWIVELDLRAPWMVRGKKGFERLVRAADEVLCDARTWLFRDLSTRTTKQEGQDEGVDESEDVLPSFHPTVVALEPEEREMHDVLVPSLLLSTSGENASSPPFEYHDDYHELIEWLDLVHLGSPRVRKTDNVDPYISRYAVPDRDTASPTDLKVLTWTGLMDQNWCVQLLIEIIRRSRRAKAREWLAFTTTSHRTQALGQVQGSMTICRPGVNVAEAQQGDQMDVDGSSDQATRDDRIGIHGLQQFLCFEFVESVKS